MGYIRQQQDVAMKIYGNRSWREGRRRWLFVLRSIKNRKQVEAFTNYFQNYAPLPDFLEKHIEVEEVINRIFFYANSSAAERLQGIQDHFDALPQLFSTAGIQQMYRDIGYMYLAEEDKTAGITIWESSELGMQANLVYIPGQRKEGLLSLLLTIDGEGLYHINFRFEKDLETSEIVVHVGTIQGYPNGLDKAKQATKKMYGYRPKNFIFFILRQLATVLGITRMKAVSDEGFYTNTHMIRGNRHKLIRFNPFWEELGGHVSHDVRFYDIPVTEMRKSLEEIKSQKRNQYRNRYAFLDGVTEEIGRRLASYVRV